MLRYLEAFFRNRWLITIPALLLLGSGAAFVFTKVPQYGATTAVWTERTSYYDVQTTDNIYISPAANQAGRMNELLGTNTFARAVADRTLPPTAAERDKAVLAALIRSGGITASPAGDHILRVVFYDADPRIALAGVQAAVEQYQSVVGQSTTLQATGASDFYQQRVKDYETNILPRVNKAVTDYVASHPELRLSQNSSTTTDPAFAVILQQAQAARDQYQSYKDQLNHISTQSQASTSSLQASFRLLDPPSIIAGTGTLRKKTMLIYAGAGVGVAFSYIVLFLGLATELDGTLRNPGDVRRRLQLPILDVIPEYTVTGSAQPAQGAGRRNRQPVAASAQ